MAGTRVIRKVRATKGRAKAEAERDKDGEADQAALRQGDADGRGHERRRARGGDDNGQHAGQEGAETRAGSVDGACAGPLQRGADLEDARHVERHQQHDHGQDGDDEGRLQLEAPAKRGAEAMGDIEQDGQDDKAGDGACPVEQGLAARQGRVVTGSRQAEQFHRQHGEDARHQVEDQAAGKGQQHGDNHAADRGVALVVGRGPQAMDIGSQRRGLHRHGIGFAIAEAQYTGHSGLVGKALSPRRPCVG